jgi:hypothetical protein
MSLLRIADSFYVGVKDLSASITWYIEKLGLKKAKVELDEPEGCVGLVFPKELPTAVVLGPPRTSTSEGTRMLYTGDVDGARKWLNSRAA